jgi:hypothetical protein
VQAVCAFIASMGSSLLVRRLGFLGTAAAATAAGGKIRAFSTSEVCVLS